VAPDNNILIYPGDSQFSAKDTLELIERFEVLRNLGKKHINILTIRTVRSDSTFNRFRGFVWRKLIQLRLRSGQFNDPASQLRILCKCCIPESKFSDFMWDVDIFRYLNDKALISEHLEVGFYARPFGSTSVKFNFLNTEFKSLIKLFKMK
jgi:hypothetical protein